MCLTVLSGEATTCHPLLGYAVSHLSFSTPALISFLPLVFPYSVPGTPLNLYPCPGISRNPLPRPPPNFSPPHLSSPPPAQALLPRSHPSTQPSDRSLSPLNSCPPSPQLLPPGPTSDSYRRRKPCSKAGGEAREALSQAGEAGGVLAPRTLPPTPQPAPLGEHQQLELTIWQHVFLLRFPPSRCRGSIFRKSPQKPSAQAPS